MSIKSTSIHDVRGRVICVCSSFSLLALFKTKTLRPILCSHSWNSIKPFLLSSSLVLWFKANNLLLPIIRWDRWGWLLFSHFHFCCWHTVWAMNSFSHQSLFYSLCELVFEFDGIYPSLSGSVLPFCFWEIEAVRDVNMKIISSVVTSHAFDTDTSMMWWFLKSGATVWLSKLVFPHVFTQRLLWLDDEQCVHEKGDQNQGQQDTISKSALKHRQKDRAAFSDFFWQNGWRDWSVFGISAPFWLWSVISVPRSSRSLGEMLWTRFQPEMGRGGEHFETEGSHTRTGGNIPGYAWMNVDCRLCMWLIPSLDLALTTSRVLPPPSSAPASCFSVSGQGGRCRTWSTPSAPQPCSASPSPSPGSSLPT